MSAFSAFARNRPSSARTFVSVRCLVMSCAAFRVLFIRFIKEEKIARNGPFRAAVERKFCRILSPFYLNCKQHFLAPRSRLRGCGVSTTPYRGRIARSARCIVDPAFSCCKRAQTRCPARCRTTNAITRCILLAALNRRVGVDRDQLDLVQQARIRRHAALRQPLAPKPEHLG